MSLIKLIVNRLMLKKLAVSLFVLGALIAPKSLFAQEANVCVQIYGGGVVCGAKHEAIDTDLADVNTFVVGGGLLISSFVLFKLSRKYRVSHIS